MVKIAVEYPFTDIRQALQNKGYQTDMVEQEADASVYDVVVVRNQYALNGSLIRASLVETRGRSVDEIVKEVEERLQRAGKIPGTAKAEKSASGGGGFTSGILTGAVVGAAAALLMTPKSGKEMQSLVKEKIPGGSSDGESTLSQVKEKAAQTASQVKDKAMEMKDKKSSDGQKE
ncbi:YkuS family protein [Planococcus sp. CAU13]|uniref:YkuS family protein n=1 Tax=Planococcus sp. CAU13 TaxID=1541197 RepID=UPI00068AA09B|nr:YkuS family protein [Planococcus sp. CAU13]